MKKIKYYMPIGSLLSLYTTCHNAYSKSMEDTYTDFNDILNVVNYLNISNNLFKVEYISDFLRKQNCSGYSPAYSTELKEFFLEEGLLDTYMDINLLDFAELINSREKLDLLDSLKSLIEIPKEMYNIYDLEVLDFRDTDTNIFIYFK